jgi:hypothetical protein
VTPVVLRFNDTNIWNGNRVEHQYALINTNDINLIWTPYNANERKNVSNFIFKQKSKYEAKDLGTSNLEKWRTQAALDRNTTGVTNWAGTTIEMFYDTKRVIRIRKPKDRQYKG